MHTDLRIAPPRSARCRPGRASRAAAFFKVVLTATVIAGYSAQAQAQSDYPARSARILVPYAAGSIGDITARILADKLSAKLGQQYLVENRPGAGGIAAAKAGSSADPDGYTLMLTGNNYAITTAMLNTVPYDIIRDFAPVSTLAYFDVLVATRAGSPLKSMQDVVTYAKANPGKLNIGTLNLGSTQYLVSELFKTTAGIQAATVPYRSSPDVTTATLRGDVDIALEVFGPLQSLLDDKQLVALASTGAKRARYLPQLPTVSETGVADIEGSSWNSISVPSKTPKPIIDLLNKAIIESLALPEVQEMARKTGVDLRGSTPEEAAAVLASNLAKWTRVMEKAGIPKRD